MGKQFPWKSEPIKETLGGDMRPTCLRFSTPFSSEEAMEEENIENPVKIYVNMLTICNFWGLGSKLRWKFEWNVKLSAVGMAFHVGSSVGSQSALNVRWQKGNLNEKGLTNLLELAEMEVVRSRQWFQKIGREREREWCSHLKLQRYCNRSFGISWR